MSLPVAAAAAGPSRKLASSPSTANFTVQKSIINYLPLMLVVVVVAITSSAISKEEEEEEETSLND